MKKLLRALIIGWAILGILSCRPSDDELPTITPPPPTAPSSQVQPAGDEGPITPIDTHSGTRQNLLRATVQIVALSEEAGGQLQPMWSGSGSIISPDGLILTNAHVASDPDPSYRPDALGVALTIRSDEPPEPTYLADVMAIDHELDLAVIQIVSDLDGRPVAEGELNLSYVPVGDSGELELGDLLQILGYPGIGGETITFTEGVVSGFTRERGVGGRAYVKTDATIAGGNSGGLAANATGRLVGVPTQVGYGGAERFADCRYLEDTNGDGVIDENDNCIPVGGFINALRPVNLARPLIEAARTGIAPRESPKRTPTQPTGAARFHNLVFGPDVTENDQPTQIVSQLPSGATGVFCFWDYDGMAPGTTKWEARWYRDGAYMEDVSWPSATWQGDTRGSWWVAVTNDQGLTDGTYGIELYAGGERLAEASIPVGGSTVGGPGITIVTFSSSETRPSSPTFLLPSGITTAYAFLDYENMRDGTSWQRTWYYEGDLLATGPDTWDEGSSGSTLASLSAEDPLAPGSYRLEVYVEDTLVAASGFAVAGTTGRQAIGSITFASGVDAQGNPVNAGTSFPAGTTQLYYFVDYTGMRDGLGFSSRWLLGGEEIVTFDQSWEGGERGTYFDYIYQTSGDPLPGGEYTLQLSVEGQLVQQGEAVVGGGQGPTPIPPPEDGLYVYGYVLDADTGQGIPGALFVVLTPGVTFDGWDGSDAAIYASAETDANGYFELSRPLERNESYTMITWAEGYEGTYGDDILVSDEESPFEMEIELQRE